MSPNPLTPREAYQVLRDIALGIRSMRRVSEQPWDSGQITVEVEGWLLTLCSAGGALDHCASCQAPDGRAYVLGSGQRFGTHPVELMSTWELKQVQTMLAAL
ncbi:MULTISPECIES: DUF7693 family protein [unclassified Pseudomonas]|uniref:DUF7693 family protein n=1 Tax=unclassified Pseudomonas TaxID=196821 RepID=UPI00257BFB98|nr:MULTISPECIES: hypothetical protein [unclassified Pseudomonas]